MKEFFNQQPEDIICGFTVPICIVAVLIYSIIGLVKAKSEDQFIEWFILMILSPVVGYILGLLLPLFFPVWFVGFYIPSLIFKLIKKLKINT